MGEVGFASQKQYLSLYILKQAVLDTHRAELAGLSVGKGCIRYRNMNEIDFNLVRCILKETFKSTGSIC